MICSTNIYDQIKTLSVSFADFTQFVVNHLPVFSKMNVRDVVNEEDDSNYLSGYRMILDDKYQQLLTNE